MRFLNEILVGVVDRVQVSDSVTVIKRDKNVNIID